MGPVTEDLTIAWQNFDDQTTTARKDCFTALVGLVDGIGKDLAGKWLHAMILPLTNLD